MRPTPEEILAGADRVLRAMNDEHDLPAEAAATLADVLRMLGQARRAVAERPAFLDADNERLRALLAELIRDLPAGDAASRERVRTYLSERIEANPG